MKTWIDANRSANTPFDIVIEGHTPGDDPAKATAQVAQWQQVGVTWWIEALWDKPQEEVVLARIRQGPPPSP